ncbi:MAG: hypothetical protein GY822_11115 [Deltaproteobacteria bacterium]|nr:hypothetical protein [Deltaproteobacteria bacterium]
MSEKMTVDFLDALSNLESETNSHISRHELECFIAGDLVKERRGEIEAQLLIDAPLKARVERLFAVERAFQTKMPFARFEKDFESRASAQNSSPEKVDQRGENSLLQRFMDWAASPSAIGGSALVGAAALFFLVASPGDETGLRSKGAKEGVKISFYVQSEKGARLGVDGEELREGERLQFALHDDLRARAMVVVGIDGNGQVSIITSESFAEKTNTTKGGVAPKKRLLTESLVLDDTVGAERFFVIYSEGSLAELQKAAQTAAEEIVASHKDLEKVEVLDVKSLSQSSIHIVKTAGSKRKGSPAALSAP